MKLIVPSCPPVVQTTVYHIQAKGLHLVVDLKPPLQLLDCQLPLYEAAHTLAVAAVHHLHQCDYLLLVPQHRRKPLVEQPPEVKVLLRVKLANHLHILAQQLERYLLLQLNALPWSVRQ